MTEFRKESFAIVRSDSLFEFMTDTWGRDWFSCFIGPAWTQCVYVDVGPIFDSLEEYEADEVQKEVQEILESAINEGIYHLLVITY